MQELPEIKTGHLACWQCESPLERTTGRSLSAALACAFTTLILLFPANLMTFLHVSVAGFRSHSHLASGAVAIWAMRWPLLAIIVAAQAVVLPFFRFGMLTAVLMAMRAGKANGWVGMVFRWSEQLDLWAMPDVFLIGLIIGYSRIAARVPLGIGAGAYCLVGAAFMTMLTRATLDRRAVWRRIEVPPAPEEGRTIGCTGCFAVLPAAAEGGHCPRCRARLWARKPFAITYATALVVAGYVLYPIANIYPMSILNYPGGQMQHTIFTGVRQLVDSGFLPLGAIIFTTSIAIPMLKLVGMTWFFISVKRRSRRHLVTKTRLYRLIDEIGRWSNMDVYTLMVFAPLIQFGQLANVRIGTGAPAFEGVIFLTMLASRLFDPRLMWDAAGVTE